MSKKYTTNFLEDTNGSTGSANQVLVSTAAGIDWVDGSGSGIIGGPYLPLSAGASYPLTGVLYVGGTIRNNSGDLEIRNQTSTGFATATKLKQQTTNGLETFLTFDGTTRAAYFSNQGNVGIGTTSPGAPLHINADAPTLRLQDATSGDNHYLIGNNGELRVQTSGYMTMRPGNTVSTTFLANGNVGIGTTSPSYPLEIAQTGYGLGVKNYITSTDVANSILVGYDPGAVYLGYGYGSKEVHIASLNTGNVRIRTSGDTIVENGNVGIGTTSPAYKLEVDGQVLSDGYRLAAMQTAPATRNSTGTLGEIVIDGNHIYVCYATDSWSRVALDTSW